MPKSSQSPGDKRSYKTALGGKGPQVGEGLAACRGRSTGGNPIMDKIEGMERG